MTASAPGARVTSVTPATPAQWDTAWATCDYATFFHSRKWAEIWVAYEGEGARTAAMHVSFDDGASAVIPALRRRRALGLITTTESSPAGTYGGWIGAGDLSAAHARELTRVMLQWPNLRWRANPFDPHTRDDAIPVTSHDATHAIVLEGGFDAVEKRWKKNNSAHLRNVRKAGRAGIEVTRAGGAGDFREYFEVYQSTLERWGGRASSAYRRELFDAIHARLDDDIALWVARDGATIVAGALCFYASRHAVYWHGAALESHFDRRPVNLLMYEIARDACDRGMSWFDLNPSGGQEGVERFKRSLGAESFPSPVVTTATPLARVARWIRGKR